MTQKQKLGTFDSLYKTIILKLFNQISDKRKSNASYDLLDALKSGFAIYSQKCASLFSFRTRSTAEDSNLNEIYGINKIPSDNGLRKILDNVCPKELRKGFYSLYKRIRKMGILDTYRFWNNYLIVSIDGVEHFCSKKVNCKHCMTRTHRNNTSSYYHSMLSAAIVCPNKKEVFVLENEPIVKQDGAVKNDCERNAAKRLLGNLQSLYNQEFIVYVMDALYSCAPIIKQITQTARWKYVIGITLDGNKSLFRQFEERNDKDKIHWISFKDGKDTYQIGYGNNFILNDSASDVICNALYCIKTSAKGVETHFSWVTNIKLTKHNVRQVMQIGRSRWKIENEVFNTLKNQDYNFKHNFGHGQNYLCTVFAFLMMMAFTIDQIQQNSCHYFKTLLTGLKTRIKLWKAVRACFTTTYYKNMKELYVAIGNMYKIKLE